MGCASSSTNVTQITDAEMEDPNFDPIKRWHERHGKPEFVSDNMEEFADQAIKRETVRKATSALMLKAGQAAKATVVMGDDELEDYFLRPISNLHLSTAGISGGNFKSSSSSALACTGQLVTDLGILFDISSSSSPSVSSLSSSLHSLDSSLDHDLPSVSMHVNMDGVRSFISFYGHDRRKFDSGQPHAVDPSQFEASLSTLIESCRYNTEAVIDWKFAQRRQEGTELVLCLHVIAILLQYPPNKICFCSKQKLHGTSLLVHTLEIKPDPVSHSSAPPSPLPLSSASILSASSPSSIALPGYLSAESDDFMKSDNSSSSSPSSSSSISSSSIEFCRRVHVIALRTLLNCLLDNPEQLHATDILFGDKSSLANIIKSLILHSTVRQIVYLGCWVLSFCLKSPDLGVNTLDHSYQQALDGGLPVIGMMLLSHPSASKRELHELAVRYIVRRVELASNARLNIDRTANSLALSSALASTNLESSDSNLKSTSKSNLTIEITTHVHENSTRISSDESLPSSRFGRFLIPKITAFLLFSGLVLTINTQIRSMEIQTSVIDMLTELSFLRPNASLLFSIDIIPADQKEKFITQAQENEAAASATLVTPRGPHFNSFDSLSTPRHNASRSSPKSPSSSSPSHQRHQLAIDSCGVLEAVMRCVQRYSYKDSLNEQIQQLGCQFFQNVALVSAGRRECRRLGVVAFLDRNVAKNSMAYEASQIVYSRITGTQF